MQALRLACIPPQTPRKSAAAAIKKLHANTSIQAVEMQIKGAEAP